MSDARGPGTSGGYSDRGTFTAHTSGAAGVTFTSGGGRQRRRRGWAGLGLFGSLGGFLLFFCGMFFGLSWLLSPEPDVGAAQPVAVAQLQGRDVVAVAYSRDGPRGMFQLLFQLMFQSRLAAMDAETGESVWDVRLDDELANDMRVLAAAEGFVYVASDEGLYIRSLADGSSVAQPDAIEGLGTSYVAELGSYDYDPARRLVVIIDQAGELRQIPVGESVSVPADAQTVAAWQSVLSDTFRFAMHFPESGEAALLADGSIVQGVPTKQGALTESLAVTSANGETRTLGDTTFLEPKIVFDGLRGVGKATVYDDSWSFEIEDYCAIMPAPCDIDTLPDEVREALDEAAAQSSHETEANYAAGSGYVLVVAKSDANGNTYTLSSVSLETGEVIDTADGALGYTVGGGYSNEGVTALIAESADAFGSDLLVTATGDGMLTTSTIGPSNFFGWPA